MRVSLERFPERHIDHSGEEVEHRCVEGCMPVGHGHGKQHQLGQALQSDMFTIALYVICSELRAQFLQKSSLRCAPHSKHHPTPRTCLPRAGRRTRRAAAPPRCRPASVECATHRALAAAALDLDQVDAQRQRAEEGVPIPCYSQN